MPVNFLLIWALCVLGLYCLRRHILAQHNRRQANASRRQQTVAARQSLQQHQAQMAALAAAEAEAERVATRERALAAVRAVVSRTCYCPACVMKRLALAHRN